MRDNLILRGNTYHVRLALPEDVRPSFGGRKLLSKSLKTGLKQDAKDRARSILLDWKNQIEQVRQKKASQAELWRESLASQAKSQDERFSNALIAYSKGTLAEKLNQQSSESVHLNLQLTIEEFLAKARRLEDLGINGAYEQVRSLIEEGLKKDNGLNYLSAYSAFIREIQAKLTAKKYNLTEQEKSEASLIIANPNSYKPKSPITRSMLDAWEKHLATQIETEKTRDRLKQSMTRFSEYLTTEGKTLNFDTVHSFLGTLSPARQTRSNYLWAGRTFWKWAIKYQQYFREQFETLPCPFNGHELPKTGDAAGRKRLAFTKQEIEKLHQKALEKGSIPLANLIMFASLTGARLEEIGRIRPEHTLFDTNNEPIGFNIIKSKSTAGIREVPLHAKLIPLYKKLTEKSKDNDGYLFPGGHNKYGNRLDGLSKKFGRLKSNDYGKDHTFHSIRHSVATMLHRAGVSMEILPYILGHETGVFTLSQYSKGPSFVQKMKAINLLEFGFDAPDSTS